MVTLHQSPHGGKSFYAVKGSPSKVLDMCRYRMGDAGPMPFTAEQRSAVQRENERMAGEAIRVIGVACATVESGDFEADKDLAWLGLVGMVDPIRESAPDLMQVYHRAGIETIMITGDQRLTADAVARRLQLSKGREPVILDSAEMVTMDAEVLKTLVSRADVYSRVSPRHKLRIVQALQSAGKVVAMTGDGINDSPALKAADIGIAMGKSGTEVAREVADIVLQEDDLEAMAIAVRYGRTTYDNIRKTLRFLLATNMSEITVMLTSMAAGTGMPLTVMQLLWINLISDVLPGFALCFEGPEGDVLKRLPRDPHAPILNGSDFRRLGAESATIAAGAMGAYGYGLLRYGRGVRAGAMALQTLALGQLLYAVSCRSEHTSIFDGVRRPRNPYFGWVIWGSVALQIMTAFIAPLRNLLGIVRPSLADAAVIAAGSLLPLLVTEQRKGSVKSHRSGNLWRANTPLEVPIKCGQVKKDFKKGIGFGD